MDREKNLLLSDELLAQVLKDANLLRGDMSEKFRSFDLGQGLKAGPNSDVLKIIDRLRHNLNVALWPDRSAIGIRYDSLDAGQSEQVVSLIVNKYIDWRANGIANGFDAEMVAADKNLAARREDFLNSQRAFLDFVEQRAARREEVEDNAAQKQKIENEISALKKKYGPLHPAMQAAQKKLAALKANDASRNTANDQIRFADLRDTMDRNFEKLDAAIRNAVALQQRKTNAAPFEIVPSPKIQVTSSDKMLKFKYAWAAFLSLLSAWLYLKLRPLLHPAFDSANDVNRVLKVPVIATVPIGDVEGALEVPSGSMADALKKLRAEIKLRLRTIPTKLVTITATTPDEARAAIIGGMARLSAARGAEKILIIDADLRAPTFQTFFPTPRTTRNLVDYLSGQVRIEDIIIRTDPSGAHIIYGTSVPNTALDLISSDKMKTLLHSLREVYDLVLVQAPLAGDGPDARVLGALSDQVLYIVGKRHALKSEVAEAIAPFRLNGGLCLSIVLQE